MLRSATGLLPALSILLPLTAVACRTDGDMESARQWEEALQLPVGVAADALPDPDSEGARLTARYCSQCHGIPSPGMHSAQEWPATVRRMAMRMEHSGRMGRMMGSRGMMGGRGMMGRWRGRMPMGMMGAESPTRVELGTILAYLQEYALKAAPAPPPDTATDPGAGLFAASCSRCHALPDPQQHTPAEWPDVVARMRRNMETMGAEPITDDEARQIVEYLQRASGA
ncbi:MAG: c-type cytochrome [Gemmatimonadota bacterium]